MTPILGGLSVAAILVVISEMLWFNRRLHALEPLRRRSMHFLRLIGDDRVSNAMCATKEQAGLYLFGTAMQVAETPPLPAAHLVLIGVPSQPSSWRCQ